MTRLGKAAGGMWTREKNEDHCKNPAEGNTTRCGGLLHARCQGGSRERQEGSREGKKKGGQMDRLSLKFHGWLAIPETKTRKSVGCGENA